jgi:hypothetical protein
MTVDTRRQLYQALKAHKFDLDIIRSITSGIDLVVLDRRIEAAQLLLEWLQNLELEPAVPRHERNPVGDVIASHRP